MPKFFQPEQIYLSNGIPVILQNYDAPVAATYWWVRTGSADEAPHEAGFAHFLEHMLFKDAAAKETGRASTGRMARTIESLGGEINAYTSFDQTVYHVTCASHHWERVIDAFGVMARPQKFLRSDFEREREVILEELRKNEDSPGRQLFQTLFSLTFRKHPYGKPVIGYTKTLKAASVTSLETFYRRGYVSGRMGLVLVGPIHGGTPARRKAILKYLEKHFGSERLSARKASPVLRTMDAQLTQAKRPPIEVKPFDVKTPTLSFSFRVPELGHADIPALDLLAGILGMGELSRLYQNLFYQKSLVTEASAGLYVPHDPGMLYFQAEMEDVGKIKEVSEEMFREMRRVREEGPTLEEIERVIVNIESEKLYATQTADGMASRLGFLRFILGDLDFDQKYLEELRSVDSARIREIAATYLDPARMSGVVMVPEDQKGFDGSAIVDAALRGLSREAGTVAVASARHRRKSAVPKAESPVEFFTLPSGMRIAYFERPNSHVFSVHASALGGLRLELASPVESAASDWGSSYMMALTWTKGTTGAFGAPSLEAREIAAIVEGSAGSLDGFSGRNSVGLQVTGLARDWGRLSELFTGTLLSPSFPEIEVGHSRRIAEDAIRGIEDHTSQLCTKLFLETLFERHPYGKLTVGSMDSVQRIDSAKLSRFHKAWIKPERLTVAVSGPIKRVALDAWLSELDRRARRLSEPSSGAGSQSSIPDEESLRAPRWVERSLGREQIHILVGGLGTRITSEDRYPLSLMQTLLGGQSGRLFVELREKKSLAYTVAPVSFEGLERGYIGTYIACSPEKRDEAIRGIQTVLERLAERGPTAQEMTRAREYFLGRRAMDMQSDSALAAHFGLEALYGLPHRDEDAYVKLIRSITAKKVQQVCRRYLVEPFMVTCVVG